jgi:hypothetical protein
MVRKNKDYWQDHINSWRNSNQTPHRFCKENNLIQSTFMRWIEKLETKITPMKVEIPVIPKTNKEIIIEGYGIKIILPYDIDSSLLSATIREVGRCS